MSVTQAPAQPIRRNTRQRQLVLDAVQGRCDHPTAEDIYLAVHAVDDRISRGTVYRNLNLLAETGVITTVKTPGVTRFDRRCDGHSHVVCTTCGAVADMPLPYDSVLDERAAASTDFNIASHTIVFEGTCPACAKCN
ncbi:MAG: transcriptional repressor [Coriobacteriaceae bacterium]|nr:transcriptional repressor [Coriobacteriaceae bacterium]